MTHQRHPQDASNITNLLQNQDLLVLAAISNRLIELGQSDDVQLLIVLAWHLLTVRNPGVRTGDILDDQMLVEQLQSHLEPFGFGSLK